jgi:hypothetical protein
VAGAVHRENLVFGACGHNISLVGMWHRMTCCFPSQAWHFVIFQRGWLRVKRRFLWQAQCLERSSSWDDLYFCWQAQHVKECLAPPSHWFILI